MKGAFLSIVLLGGVAGAAAVPIGCSSSSSGDEPKKLTAETIRNPESCRPCHAQHYDDWLASMHAYATDDPVFVAMNKRGQRETNGKLGTFCVQCHAPLAVKDKLTDGSDLDKIPANEKGINCYFCHSIDAVGASHVNADITLAKDLTMRGEITDPQDNQAHKSAHSAFQDGEKASSAAMCGTCHDIDSPVGGHIERTFKEWQASFFGLNNNTCAFNGNCHMDSTPNVPVALNGPKNRKYHDHGFVAVDTRLDTATPDTSAVEKALGTVLQGALCVTDVDGGIRVFLDNAGAGHSWPSGAAQDRRVWVEVNAYTNGDATPFYSSGHVAPGTVVGSDPKDPDLWLIKDSMFGTDGKPVDMFWQAASACGNELLTLSSNPTQSMNTFYTHQLRWYPNTMLEGDSTLGKRPDRVTLTVHMQAVGLDVLDDLVQSGDLDPSIVSRMPTLDVPIGRASDGVSPRYTLEWTPDAPITDVFEPTHEPVRCVSTDSFSYSAQTAVDPPKGGCPAMGAADAGR